MSLVDGSSLGQASTNPEDCTQLKCSKGLYKPTANSVCPWCLEEHIKLLGHDHAITFDKIIKTAYEWGIRDSAKLAKRWAEIYAMNL